MLQFAYSRIFSGRNIPAELVHPEKSFSRQSSLPNNQGGAIVLEYAEHFVRQSAAA